jgi:hypothetical protein
MANQATFYVYEHWRLDRDECFYVGKGKGGRAYKMRDRNRFHSAVVQKVQRDGFGIEVKIVASGLTETEAFTLEKERIAFWRSSGADLANSTNGGDGVSGLKMSEEARLKMRNAKLGKKQTREQIEKRIAPLRGRKQPPDAIRKMSKARIGRPLSKAHKDAISKSHKGKIVSDEARKSLSLANKGKPWSDARRAAHGKSLAKKDHLT